MASRLSEPSGIVGLVGLLCLPGTRERFGSHTPLLGELPPGIGRRRPRSMVLRLDAGDRGWLALDTRSGLVIQRAHARWMRGRGPTLVRHGADPGEALAGVLGVPAGDVRVRDRSN